MRSPSVQLFLLFGLGVLTACGERPAPQSRASADADAPAPDSPGRASPHAEACAALVGVLTDGLGYAPSRVPDTLLTDPRGGTSPWRRRGCLLSIADTTSRSGAPAGDLDGWFRAHGWLYATAYSADGPDGTLFGFVREGVLCVVEGRWDGGDDADSTVVPAPGYELRVRCVPATPADTAR
jgi:hypothetical protein